MCAAVKVFIAENKSDFGKKKGEKCDRFRANMKSMQRLSLLLSRFWLQPRCFIYQLSLVIIRLCVFVDDMNVSHCCWLSQFTCSKMAMHIIKLFSFAKKKNKKWTSFFRIWSAVFHFTANLWETKKIEKKKNSTPSSIAGLKKLNTKLSDQK